MVNFSGFTHFVFKYHLFIICPSQDQVFTLSTYIVDFLKFHKLLSSLGAATTCFRYIWPRSSNCNNWDNPEIDYLTLIIEIIWSGGSENQLGACGDDDQGENPGLWDFDIPRKVRIQWDFILKQNLVLLSLSLFLSLRLRHPTEGTHSMRFWFS